jgi:hypothetical protein
MKYCFRVKPQNAVSIPCKFELTAFIRIMDYPTVKSSTTSHPPLLIPQSPIGAKKSATDNELIDLGKTQASKWLRP